jgi:hypothetical protein
VSRNLCVRFALVLIGVGYLIQLNSPLRLNPDAASFLRLASSTLDGTECLINGRPSHFPMGYPCVVAGLERAGIACSASIIGVNLVFLILGSWATGYVLSRSFQLETEASILVCGLTLLSWVFIKHVTLPVSDVVYFGLAMPSLAALVWSNGKSIRPALVALAVAAVFLAAAIAVRTIGIALIPAFLVSCGSRLSWRTIAVWLRKRPGASLLLLASCGASAAAFCAVVMRSSYFQEMIEFQVGPRQLALFRLVDWGELVLNAPVAKMPASLRPVLLATGALGALLVGAGAWVRRGKWNVIDVYMIGYTAILLVWPYFDARFWLPVFPLLAAYLALALKRIAGRQLRPFVWGYLAAYCLTGLLALYYSSRISLAGERFGEVYAGGAYREAYRSWFTSLPLRPDTSSSDDRDLVQLLERFGRRDRIAPGQQKTEPQRQAGGLPRRQGVATRLDNLPEPVRSRTDRPRGRQVLGLGGLTVAGTGGAGGAGVIVDGTIDLGVAGPVALGAVGGLVLGVPGVVTGLGGTGAASDGIAVVAFAGS